MRVKIQNTWFDSNEQPVMVELSMRDKQLIRDMAPDATQYCCYPQGVDPAKIERWMRDEETPKDDDTQ